jgi:hypothetical protein
MSVQSKILAVAAALTLAGGVGAAGTLPASAATTTCGQSCTDLYSRAFSFLHHPLFALDVLKQHVATSPVGLYAASDGNPGEDFTVSAMVPVAKLKKGLVSAAVAKHYASDVAFEIQYAPDGAPSGRCVGVGTTTGQGTEVSLRPCGASGGKTLWIVDSWRSITGSFVALINGSNANFSTPYVLTYPAAPFGVFRSGPLETSALADSGRVPANQLWSAASGALPGGYTGFPF